jgi:hypothetical protein
VAMFGARPSWASVGHERTHTSDLALASCIDPAPRALTSTVSTQSRRSCSADADADADAAFPQSGALAATAGARASTLSTEPGSPGAPSSDCRAKLANRSVSVGPGLLRCGRM